MCDETQFFFPTSSLIQRKLEIKAQFYKTLWGAVVSNAVSHK